MCFTGTFMTVMTVSRWGKKLCLGDDVIKQTSLNETPEVLYYLYHQLMNKKMSHFHLLYLCKNNDLQNHIPIHLDQSDAASSANVNCQFDKSKLWSVAFFLDNDSSLALHLCFSCMFWVMFGTSIHLSMFFFVWLWLEYVENRNSTTQKRR